MEYRGRVNVDHILNGPFAEQLVGRVTQEVAAKARAAAPKDTGELASSIRAFTVKNGGAKRDRTIGIVSAGTDHSAAAEFGTSKQRGSYFLRGSLPR